MCRPRASPHEGVKLFSLTAENRDHRKTEGTGPQRLRLWPRPIALDTWGEGKVTAKQLQGRHSHSHLRTSASRHSHRKGKVRPGRAHSCSPNYGRLSNVNPTTGGMPRMKLQFSAYRGLASWAMPGAKQFQQRTTLLTRETASLNQRTPLKPQCRNASFLGLLRHVIGNT